MKSLMVLFALLLNVHLYSHAQSKKELARNRVFTESYLAIKDKLVLNDSVSTKRLAVDFYESLKSFSPGNIPPDSAETFGKLKKKLTEYAGKMAATQNVNRQREHFSAISQLFWRMSGMIKMSAGGLYYQQCPMTGVTWLSSEDVIKNPYYPKNMLSCGKVIGKREGI